MSTQVAGPVEPVTPEVAPVAPPVATPVASTTPKATAPVEPAPEAELSGKTLPDDVDGEDLAKYVDKDGKVHLPFKAFQTRITRASKSTLKAVFGTDDRDEIKKMRDEYEAMLTARETERRERLDELAREREDKEHEKLRADELARTLDERDEREAIGQIQTQLESFASKHVSAEYSDFALDAFKKHINKLDDEAIDALSEKEIGEFFQDLAKKKPAMARVVETPPEPKKVGITNGPGGGNNRPAKTPQTDGKTARPGQQNSMSTREIRSKYGVSW
jgi:hypothetical protein